MRNFNLENFVRGYMLCALWSSVVCDEDGNNCHPLDDDHDIDDLAPECLKAMREACTDFAKANHADLLAYCERYTSTDGSSPETCAGHDFWLTRNRHGAGFWDRGLGDLGERLSDAAKVYGTVYLYVCPNGLIYGE